MNPTQILPSARPPEAGPVWLERAEERLLELWLMTDPDLARHVAARQLAPLGTMTAARRARTQETLLAWLSSRGNVEQMAKMLQVHPQTVRYRMRGIDKDLGPLLDDPEWRLTTEMVLRQLLLAGRTDKAPAAAARSWGKKIDLVARTTDRVIADGVTRAARTKKAVGHVGDP